MATNAVAVIQAHDHAFFLLGAAQPIPGPFKIVEVLGAVPVAAPVFTCTAIV
jgi:hypothetical protein